MKLPTKHWKLILTGALITFIVTILALNLRPHQVRVDQEIDISYSVTDGQFQHMMGHILSTPIIDGNQIDDFQNGDEIFPAMLDAINTAKVSISFESYIYWSGEIGEKFLVALSEKARAGVKVHVLIDWVGSQKIEEEYVQKMKDAGVVVEFFHPLKWYNIFRMNSRTHRKILVVDGHTSFTGGVGISDDWLGKGDNPTVWRDSHYRARGPISLYFQTAFMDNWLKTRPRVLHDEHYFPVVPKMGSVKAQVFLSSPREGGASMRLMYLLAIAASKKSIRIESAYFVPDQVTIEQLVKAKNRGVDVKVIIPGPHTDSATVKLASQKTWGELLKAGIEIYEFQAAKFHVKKMIVDNYFVSVGSTNMDDRSFRLNSEFNLNVYDPEFASKQMEIFKGDMKNSKIVTLDAWEKRPLTEKIAEAVILIFRNQL